MIILRSQAVKRISKLSIHRVYWHEVFLFFNNYEKVSIYVDNSKI